MNERQAKERAEELATKRFPVTFVGGADVLEGYRKVYFEAYLQGWRDSQPKSLVQRLDEAPRGAKLTNTENGKVYVKGMYDLWYWENNPLMEGISITGHPSYRFTDETIYELSYQEE